MPPSADSGPLCFAGRHVTDGDWAAYYVLTGKDQMALVIEQGSPDCKMVTSVPLTAPRARELRRLLRERCWKQQASG